ncbi:STAS domain-containing protein, partial [Marinobacter sp. BW6]|uniref:STAS domain-containing protein n=1 Tax=Marinobacter sp. BW6 TaxID=2592624 RepID=UPI0011DEC511
MAITEDIDRDIPILSIDGRLDGSTSDEVTAVVLKRVPDVPALVLDLRDVTYVSSAGLRVMIMAAKAARASK